MSASIQSIQNIRPIPVKKYTPNDDPKTTYKHITRIPNGKYQITKRMNGKQPSFGDYKTRADAVHERDILVELNWDVDLWVELETTNPGFTDEDLPPFPENRGNRDKRFNFGFNGTAYINKTTRPWKRVWQCIICYNNKKSSLGVYCDPLSADLVYSIVKKEVIQSDKH